MKELRFGNSYCCGSKELCLIFNLYAWLFTCTLLLWLVREVFGMKLAPRQRCRSWGRTFAMDNVNGICKSESFFSCMCVVVIVLYVCMW